MEEEDSRTALIGHKRDLGTMAHVEVEQLDEGISSGEVLSIHERTKRDDGHPDNEADSSEAQVSNAHAIDSQAVENSLTAGEGVIASADKVSAESTKSSRMFAAKPWMELEASRPNWNKSAQSALRTSFGNKKKALPKHLEATKMDYSTTNQQSEVVSSVSESGVTQGLDEAIDDRFPADCESFQVESPTAEVPEKDTAVLEHKALSDGKAPVPPQSAIHLSSRLALNAEEIELARAALEAQLKSDLPHSKRQQGYLASEQQGTANESNTPCGDPAQVVASTFSFSSQPLPPMIAPGKCPATSKAVFCAPAPAPKSKVPVYCFGIDGMHRIQMPPMLRKGELLPISELRFVDFVDHIIQVNPPIPSAGLRNIRNSFNVYVAEHYKGMALTDAQKYKVTSQSKGGSRNPGVKEATARALNHFAGTGQQHPPTFPSPAQQSVPVDLTGPSVEPKIYATRGSTSVAKPNDVVGKIPEARMPPNFKVSAAGVSSVKNPDQVSWLDADMDDVDSIDDEDEESGEIISGEDKPESVLEDTVPEGAIGEDDFAEKTDTAKTISEVVFSEAEVILAQKYFPAAEDVAFKPRCLACAETTHSTLNCPLLTCGVCSGSHTTFQCIENHLCGRCRQRGHPATQCIEKLLPIRSEMTCDFCNSVTHLEDSCQRNWRTYLPKLDEIVPRSNVPVFCYYCGGSGHYGDECGLQRINQSDSEGTWSRSSREMYAITITPVDVKPKNRGFSIKGKANDPITLDDSDDEVEFVRPKINNPPARQRRDFGPGSGAHMKIDSNNSRGLPPAPRQKLGTNYPSQPPLPHASIPPYTAVQQYGSLPTAPLTKTKYPDAPVYPHQGGAPSRPKQGHPPSSSRGGFSALAGRGGLGFNGGQRAGISTRGGGNFGAPKNSNKRKAKKNAAAPAAAQANNGVAKKPKKPRIKAKHKGGPQ